jgi:hypothetical protein
LAGGFITFIYTLQMLRLIPSGLKTSSEEEKEGIEKENVAMVPLATPLLRDPYIHWEHFFIYAGAAVWIGLLGGPEDLRQGPMIMEKIARWPALFRGLPVSGWATIPT